MINAQRSFAPPAKSTAIINIAKSQLGMVEDDYRAMLMRITGVASLRAMTDVQKAAVLTELKRLGFKSKPTSPKRPSSKKSYVRLIFAIWGELKRAGIWKEADPKSLRVFVKKMSGVDDPEFLSYAQATPIIEALKKMKGRG